MVPAEPAEGLEIEDRDLLHYGSIVTSALFLLMLQSSYNQNGLVLFSDKLLTNHGGRRPLLAGPHLPFSRHVGVENRPL